MIELVHQPLSEDVSPTVVVTRRVKPGREDDYLAWSRLTTEVASQFEGHKGVTIQGPGPDNEFYTMFRFDTVEHLQAWEASEERQDCLSQLRCLVEGDARVDHLTGLEYLFEHNSDQASHPSSHKMALVLIVVVFSMLSMLRPIASLLLSGMPDWLILLLTVIVQVLLMTYVVMPYVRRWLANWLEA